MATDIIILVKLMIYSHRLYESYMSRELLTCTGKWFGVWAELEDGGWVLTHTSGVQIDVGATCNELLVSVDNEIA